MIYIYYPYHFIKNKRNWARLEFLLNIFLKQFVFIYQLLETQFLSYEQWDLRLQSELFTDAFFSVEYSFGQSVQLPFPNVDLNVASGHAVQISTEDR